MSIRVNNPLGDQGMQNPEPEAAPETPAPAGLPVIAVTPAPEAPPVVRGVRAVSGIVGAEFIMVFFHAAMDAPELAGAAADNSAPSPSCFTPTTGDTFVVRAPAMVWVRRDTGAKRKVGTDHNDKPVIVKVPPHWVLARPSAAEQMRREVRMPKSDGSAKS